MTFSGILTALNRGKKVHWKNEGYTVVDDYKGSYYIMHLSGSCVGFSEGDRIEVSNFRNSLEEIKKSFLNQIFGKV